MLYRLEFHTLISTGSTTNRLVSFFFIASSLFLKAFITLLCADDKAQFEHIFGCPDGFYALLRNVV